jgi:hypothetical protein
MGGTANLGAAVLLLDRVIEVRTAALGPDHLDTAATLHEKAYALVQMGGSANLAAAVALYDRVIEIRTTGTGHSNGKLRPQVADRGPRRFKKAVKCLAAGNMKIPSRTN